MAEKKKNFEESLKKLEKISTSLKQRISPWKMQ